MEIRTPRGQLVTFTDASGTTQVSIVWREGFEQEINRQFATGGHLQKFIDSEYIRTVQPYVPLLTSALVSSATLGTVIGSGLVRFITPYARHQFYSGRTQGQSQTGLLRGRQWHGRWKADNITTFVQAVENVSGMRVEVL